MPITTAYEVRAIPLEALLHTAIKQCSRMGKMGMRDEASDSCHHHLHDAAKYISTDCARTRTVSIGTHNINRRGLSHHVREKWSRNVQRD